MQKYITTSSSSQVPSIDSSKPPVSNTGVEMTFESGWKVDWLSFTYTDPSKTLSDVISIVCPSIPQPARTFPTSCEDSGQLPSIPGVVAMNRGMMGYKSGLAIGAIKILYDGNEGMGIHVAMSGDACRQIEAMGLKDWADYLHRLFRSGCKFTRLDIAFDDFAGYLDLDVILASARSGNVSCHFKSLAEINSWNIGKVNSESDGKTVYFGKRSSDTFLRFYDKAAEQKQEGLHWVRAEIELKRRNAHSFVELLITAGFDFAEMSAGYLRGILDFKEPGEHCERSRWKTVDWWESFLDYAEKIRLKVESVRGHTLERAKKWLYRQVSPTIAMLVKADNGNFGLLLDAFSEGERRLKAHHLSMIYASTCTPG